MTNQIPAARKARLVLSDPHVRSAFLQSDVVTQFIDDWLLILKHVLSDEINYRSTDRTMLPLVTACQLHVFPPPEIFERVVGFVVCMTQKGYPHDANKSRHRKARRRELRELHDAAWRLSDLIHGFRPESQPYPSHVPKEVV